MKHILPGTLDIPYVNGIPFLTGGDTSTSERTLLALMNAPSRARDAACCCA